jgi:transcriptional regulator with XRE-family HTH domain
MSIHSRIKERRVELGFTSHKAFADAVGVSWQTVQQWEKEGGTAPNRSRIEKVALVLKTTPEWLLQGVGRTWLDPAKDQATAQAGDPSLMLVAEKVNETWLERLNADELRLVQAYRDLENDADRQTMLLTQARLLVSDHKRGNSALRPDQAKGADKGK